MVLTHGQLLFNTAVVAGDEKVIFEAVPVGLTAAAVKVEAAGYCVESFS